MYGFEMAFEIVFSFVSMRDDVLSRHWLSFRSNFERFVPLNTRARALDDDGMSGKTKDTFLSFPSAWERFFHFMLFNLHTLDWSHAHKWPRALCVQQRINLNYRRKFRSLKIVSRFWFVEQCSCVFSEISWHTILMPKTQNTISKAERVRALSHV